MLEVRPPSALAETGNVARAVFHIVYWTAVVIALGQLPTASGGQAAGTGLQFDEVAFATLTPTEQREYRLLREGVAAAERVRVRTGAWPAVEELAGRGVAPFIDPIDRAGYTWTRIQDGSVLDYLGVPTAASGMPTFAVVILEPEPGTPIDPTAVSDEIHRVMPDGALVHVTIWRAPGARQSSAAFGAPRVEDGWRRVILSK